MIEYIEINNKRFSIYNKELKLKYLSFLAESLGINTASNIASFFQNACRFENNIKKDLVFFDRNNFIVYLRDWRKISLENWSVYKSIINKYQLWYSQNEKNRELFFAAEISDEEIKDIAIPANFITRNQLNDIIESEKQKDVRCAALILSIFEGICGLPGSKFKELQELKRVNLLDNRVVEIIKPQKRSITISEDLYSLLIDTYKKPTLNKVITKNPKSKIRNYSDSDRIFKNSSADREILGEQMIQLIVREALKDFFNVDYRNGRDILLFSGVLYYVYSFLGKDVDIESKEFEDVCTQVLVRFNKVKDYASKYREVRRIKQVYPIYIAYPGVDVFTEQDDLVKSSILSKKIEYKQIKSTSCEDDEKLECPSWLNKKILTGWFGERIALEYLKDKSPGIKILDCTAKSKKGFDFLVKDSAEGTCYEVKTSYNKGSFYISRNELEKALLLGNSYIILHIFIDIEKREISLTELKDIACLLEIDFKDLFSKRQYKNCFIQFKNFYIQLDSNYTNTSIDVTQYMKIALSKNEELSFTDFS